MRTVGSLFSGIGGLDLGLERAGWSVRWQVENDNYCRKVLDLRWPDVPKFGDVHELTGGELEPVDLIAGGFPCQPVSIAGRRRGQDDERWLWPEFARILRVLRPRFVLVENVAGLLVRGMGDVLGDLASLGFDAEWDSIPAAAVGAPHLRYRVLVVGYARERGALGGVSDSERDGLRLERERGRKQHAEPRSTEPRADGAEEPMADAEVLSERSGLRESEETGERRRRPRDGGLEVADSSRIRRGQPRKRVVDGGPSRGGTLGEREVAEEALADSRLESERSGEGSRRTREAVGDEEAVLATRRGPEVADPYGERLEGRIFNWRDARECLARTGRLPDASEWLPEPEFRRMVDGLSERMDGGIDGRDRVDSVEGSSRLPEDLVRAMWESWASLGASPHRQGSDEQLAGELAHAMSELPYDYALGERETREEATRFVRSLRKACSQIRVLSDSREPLLPTWESLSQEDSGWVRMAVSGGPWVTEWPNVTRTAHGIPRRVDRLRGLGNAVVPQFAEWIGRRLMEIA